jgi:tetratricopeptide (TPR) repeat protein
VLAQLHRFVVSVRARRQQGIVEVPDSLPALEELERRLRRLEESDPQSIILGVARSAIRTTRSPELLTVLEPSCSEPARSDFHAAEAAFASGRYDDALVAYHAALEACPTNSVWWTWSGDAALRTAGPQEALRRYERALDLAPCNHSAHRFIADVGFQLPEPSQEDVRRSLWSAVAAVACKPDYAPGWATLAAWAQVSRVQLVRGTLGELDEGGRKDLLTATAMVSEGSPLDRRLRAFEQLQPSQNGALFGMIGQIEDPQLRRSVLAWETLDAATAAEFRELRTDALPVLIEWIARTRLQPAAEASAPVVPPKGLPLP